LELDCSLQVLEGIVEVPAFTSGLVGNSSVLPADETPSIHNSSSGSYMQE
jgi:hypothetical protein